VPQHPRSTLILARAICDASGVIASAPGAILVRNSAAQSPPLVLAAGSPEEVYRHPEAEHATEIHRSFSILFPGLINAHTHLDLTRIGPLPFDPGEDFSAWASTIRERRPAEPDQIREAVLEGVRLSRQAGTIAVGDIAGAPMGTPTLEPARALAASGMMGVSFLEFFAVGERARQSGERTIAALDEGLHEGLAEIPSSPVRLGLQPHAPYTVQPDVFLSCASAARERGIPVCTHLAEHQNEREFIQRGTGPQRAFFEKLGLWSDSLLDHYGKGLHPIEHASPALREAGTLAVHINDCPDEGIQTLVETGSRVVYCPHASAYFGSEQHFGPHRYRDMIEAGLTVALGTDSVVNQPKAQLSILEEARMLYKRDGTDPRVLLAMATTEGCDALGLDRNLVRLEPGGTPPVVLSVAVEAAGDSPLGAMLESGRAPETIPL